MDESATSVLDPAALPLSQRRRRTAIVDAAIELLKVRDLDSVQIREVAETAGVALGTVYRYFSSKDHLYAAAMLQWASDYPPWVSKQARGDTDAERLRASFHRAINAFERTPQMFRVLMAIETSADDNARDLYNAFAEQNRGALLSGLLDLDAPVATAVLGTINAVMFAQLRRWAYGRASIRAIHRAVDDSIELIFSPPP